MNLFIKPTGDPFIDVGGYVIQHLGKSFPNKNIFELIEYATNVYVKQWGGKLHTYFLNSSITQPAFNTEKKIAETLKYYRGMIEETNTEFKIGYCRIVGSETKLYVAGRSNHMMSASGAFINFHSAYESGLYLSKEALIRTFFVPLGVSFVGDKIALLQSNFDTVSYHLVAKNVDENRKNIASGIAEGTLKSEFGIVSNALFGYADYCLGNLAVVVDDTDDSIALKDVQLNMYHFTNFGASPDIELHTFSNLLFKFYAHCKKHYSKEWNAFINQHYKYSKFKDAQFDEQSQEWYNKKERLSYLDYKVWNNPILNKLVKNVSIVNHLCKWSKKHKFNFSIVEIYCINILKMEKYTIQKIKELADFVLNDKSDDQIKKSVVRLNGLKSSGDFRSYLIKLIQENYEVKNPNPLITLEDYVIYLFPDGTYWKDTRDLLLIAIYQKLHESNLIIAELSSDEDEENNENE
ncbi:type I-B CRISPR-associated protein Cas8b1/Cst1 [Flectobacillus longus]|uniref:type I-B CRISPR-associated protein Cas8b1/Cst1 n=1 Tax=Flectobacillus longus TaxID=2984207 RepID=UPI0024B83E0B|nr:type I-B CRISPR-associated protein Cas8b1/Cst1 [Flectobacillus longus]MDI9879231.1 type I-B CRISPR-associated protein Cas8b1/Cst1 [Flectobacillus longus]